MVNHRFDHFINAHRHTVERRKNGAVEVVVTQLAYDAQCFITVAAKGSTYFFS